jgi:hypothetical protein
VRAKIGFSTPALRVRATYKKGRWLTKFSLRKVTFVEL